MTKLNWEKARKRDQARASRHAAKKANALERQVALKAWATKHDLACFKCNTKGGPWAKTGISTRGPWAICARCVQSPSE